MKRKPGVILQRLKTLFVKKMPKNSRFYMILIFAVLLLLILIFSRSCSHRGADAPEEINLQNGSSVVKISALGNIQMSSDLLASAKQANGEYNFSESFSAITGYISSADLTLANLELNFCDEPYDVNSYRAPKSFAQTLHLCGIDVVQTANSATLQNGISGVESTLDALDSAGIEHIGTYRSQNERTQSNGILVKNINGIRIAFVAFSKGFGGLSLPKGKEFAADVLYQDYATDYDDPDETAIHQKIAAAKNTAPDVIIALLHWGNEFDAAQTQKQDRITQLLAEDGVDMIIGTHPNNVGAIKEFVTDGEDAKKCFVAYSLGNFFSDNQKSYANESVILDFEIRKNGLTGEISIENISYTPIFINLDETKTAPLYQVIPVRSAIKSSLFKSQKQELTDCLARLRSKTECDFDSGK